MAEILSSVVAGDIMLSPVTIVSPDITVVRAREVVAGGDFRGVVLVESRSVLGACTADYLATISSGETALYALDYCRRVQVVPAGTPVDELVDLLVPGPAPVVVIGPEGNPSGIIDPGHLVQRLWKRLILAETRLMSVVDTINEAVTIIDHHEKVVVWNRRAEELYNIPAEKIIGRSIKSFFDQLVATKVLKEAGEVRNSYHQPCEGTHVLINAGPIRCGNSLIGSISAERDITEVVQLHQDLSRANTQVRLLEKEIKNINGRHDPFKTVMGHSRQLGEALAIARRVANTNASVLIRGESGTGKDLFAEAIHRASDRYEGQFVVINCGAIPPSLFESEMFGYRKGAFTGADRRGKTGKFELADGGTIFLDEIGELPPDMQVKLLRVIQHNEFYRVGGNEPVKVDVRIVSATHRNLEEMIARGQFREDLYYRLNVVSLEIPPLRERKEDIPELVYCFLKEFSRLHNRNINQVTPEVMSFFLSYSWPGNIRELRNVLERMVILTENDTITVEYLPKIIKKQALDGTAGENVATLTDLTRNNERDIIIRALRQARGNKAEAARALGIARSTLYYRIKVLKLDRE